MKITELWRYPVKTMGGERLDRARVGPLGVEGDRRLRVEDPSRGVITARTHPRFLGMKGSLRPDGEVTVDGHPWDDARVAARVSEIAGPTARLARCEGTEGFDVLPLLVATDGAIEAFGFGGRRLRPNIVIGGVDGLAERGWPGGCLRIGSVLIGVQDLRLRCIITAYDPDTLARDTGVTRSIYERFEGKLALNCFVIQGGDLSVGDEVEWVRDRSCIDVTKDSKDGGG